MGGSGEFHAGLWFLIVTPDVFLMSRRAGVDCGWETPDNGGGCAPGLLRGRLFPELAFQGGIH